ncbi:PAS domain-containing hybrid sensor histidine kinase/response regulator [Croceicoccus sp. Ery5]|uniref:hybrid sensor histidine kinase/response regulator n=1 Tax=Croceicoccus sp. Ery5 TaxID=1703340 RepID=UPI001E54E69A|nr:PAS domain-containing hybrid sensor histidine kinase/response regulator [Croceicoccus sp. Ery5]
MSIWIIPLVAIAYAALLFWVADAGDRPQIARFAERHKRVIFGLALCVYCTSWTFYGAVGTATDRGWQFLPIYLGPIIMFTVLGRFVERILHTGKAQHSTSIADFLSARYGKSAWVAAIVTLLALFGALPYMALQLKSVSQTLGALSPELAAVLGPDQVVLAVAAVLALFAVLFGTGRPELTGHNRGLVLAIALEAVVKFAALIAVAIFAAVLLHDIPAGAIAAHAAQSYSPAQFDLHFAVMTFVSAMAVLCLPRQFHMLVVEAREDRMRGAARWLFPAYLALVCAAIVPVMLAGGMLAPAEAAPDMLLIALPLAFDANWLAIFAFIGGLSAATGMVIVTGIALSNMITNDLVVPLMFRDQMRQRGAAEALGLALVNARRATIACLFVFALLYLSAIDREATLAGLGEIAFAGAAQLSPGLLFGLFWRKANRAGMIAGLCGGFALWLLYLALPVSGIALVPPLPGDDPLVAGILLSLAVNVALFVLFSLGWEPALIDRVQAVAFIDRGQPDLGYPRLSTRTRVADFRLLLEQFVGAERARQTINALRLTTGHAYGDADAPDDALVDTSERMISAIIGSSSARALVQSTLEGDPVSIEQVVAMFDETSQRLQFGAELLQIAIENIDQGISVVDKEQRLVAWNRRYVDMFGYPSELVEVGRPIADLLRFNMRNLGVAEDAIEPAIERRLHHLGSGSRHNTERELGDGRILRILGNPAPDGGYVTSYTDITADRMAEQALEAKIRERTLQLTEANEALASATRSKTRFLAAASHDLVQPMNAARLFASALADDIAPDRRNERALLGQIDRSIETADRLLRALLDISRLDGGKAAVDPERFALDLAFADIANEFEIQAENKGLALVTVRSGLWLETDRGLFISILQNLVTNAVRYSTSGRILIGAKRRGPMAEIMVIDQGMGIAPEDQSAIFEEFTRLNRMGRSAGDGGDDGGLGLGLAIVQRISLMLGTEIRLQSAPGRGSCFSFLLPVVPAGPARPAPVPMREAPRTESGGHVLCLDNDPASLAALESLLMRWGYAVSTASHPSQVAQSAPPDLLVMDYHLDDGLTGDDAARLLYARWGGPVPTVLLTAEDSAATKAAAGSIGAERMIKPPSPPALRALMGMLLPH